MFDMVSGWFVRLVMSYFEVLCQWVRVTHAEDGLGRGVGRRFVPIPR